MDIANIFCQSLGVNVPFGLPFSNGFGIRSKKIVIRSKGWGYPLSVQVYKSDCVSVNDTSPEMDIIRR